MSLPTGDSTAEYLPDQKFLAFPPSFPCLLYCVFSNIKNYELQSPANQLLTRPQ
jgi:hypothetical protein